MSDQPLPSPEPKRERISDAEALFLEANKPKPKPKPKVKPADPAAIGQYEVQEIPLSRPEPRVPKARPVQARSPEPRLPDPRGPEPRSAEPRAPEPRLPEVNPFDDPWGLHQDQAPTPKKPVRSRTSSMPDPLPEPVSRSTSTKKPKPAESTPTVEVVEEVWTRSGEWGMTILGMLIEAICGFAGVYYLLSIEEYAVAFTAMAASGILFIFLSYPLLITLERPVRITPEQAVKDFFDALSHHFPHYLRMWLLLSTSGKTSPYYASYDGFRRYWRENLIRFRKKKVSGLTPLKFQIQDFKSEKSAGKTSIDAVFTVRVLVRGRQAEGPIETLRVSMKLVKGPDRLWYLCKGTIR